MRSLVFAGPSFARAALPVGLPDPPANDSGYAFDVAFEFDSVSWSFAHAPPSLAGLGVLRLIRVLGSCPAASGDRIARHLSSLPDLLP